MGDEKVKRKGKVRENITISWKMNKKKNGVKKKNVENGWMMWSLM